MSKYIAIDGRGGSGKTYLAGLLAERLNVPVYHLDSYGNDYQPFIGLPRLYKAVTQVSGEIVIYEGVGVFDECFDGLEPYRILVQVPDRIRRQRAAGRDVPRGDRTEGDWQEIWAIWEEAEKSYFIDEITNKANLVVGTKDGNFSIDGIMAKLAQAGIIKL